jgi:glutaredoxin 3
MSPKETVDQLINNNKVVIFSKTYCPYCTKAKKIIGKYLSGAKVVIVELDQRPDGGALQDYLGQLTGARSVPRVFIGAQCIGGGDDTAMLDSSGKLEVMLKNVGAL